MSSETTLPPAPVRITGRRAAIAVILGVAGLAITLILTLHAPATDRPTGLGNGPTHNPKYASQSSGLDRARHTQARWVNEEDEDAALETCYALGLNRLARRFHVAATPERVARAFATQWDPAFRKGAYEGCLASFHGQGG
jgi:hypothetical protein